MSTEREKVAPVDAPDGEFFFAVLSDADAGQMLKQLDETTRKLISAVLKTGGKGKVTLSITVAKCGEERQVKITPKVDASIPRSQIRERLLYADETGRLHLNDPAQGMFDFDAPVRVTGTRVPSDASSAPQRVTPKKNS